MNNPRHMSESNDHHTPGRVIEAARIALDGIELDPATTEFANSLRVKADRIFTAETNGFDKNWDARSVFLNPPGASCDEDGCTVRRVGGQWSCTTETPCGHIHKGVRSSQKAWWQKLAMEWEAQRVESAFFVGFSVEILQTTQVDQVGMLPLSFPICIPSRRLAYSRNIGEKFVVGASPPHASVLIFLPPHDNGLVRMGSTKADNVHEAIERFTKVFSPIGHVIVPWEWR